MLDYEVDRYELEFHPRYSKETFTRTFKSEDEAIRYIKAQREDWAMFRLQRIQNAIIND